MIYVVKIPCIRGFQGKATVWDVVLFNDCGFDLEGITRPLDMHDLIEVIENGEDWILNDYEFVGDFIENYSEAQWKSAQKFRINEISIDDIYPQSQWDYFCSGINNGCNS